MPPLTSRRARVNALLSEREGRGTLAAQICELCVELAGVSGVAMTLMSAEGPRGLVHATDATARRLDDVQLTLGEGPCMDAFATRAPVLAPDLETTDRHRWPEFIDLAAPALVAAVFSYPLQVGSARLGTLDLYRSTPGPMNSEQLADTLVCADVATQTLLATSHGPVELARLDDVDFHPSVAQATGMTMVQLDVDATEALLRLRAHAYVTGTLVTDVAREVTHHRLRMEAEES